MFQRTSSQWILALAFVACVAANSVASAQIGFGIGYGGGGYGGNYAPRGIYGGYGGVGGYGGGYGGYGPGSYAGYGFPNSGFGFGNYGSGSGLGNYGYGFGNGYSYAQPIYSTYNQPLYSTRVYTPQNYTLRTFSPSINSNSTNSIYSGSSPDITSPSQVVNLPRVFSSSPQVSYDNGEIILFSPPTNTREIQYTLNGAPYTMKPGTLQKFSNDRTWTVELNLGNGQNAKYTLAAGRYKFKQSETGMNLYTTREQPEAPAPAPEPVPPPALETVPLAPVPMPGE